MSGTRSNTVDANTIVSQHNRQILCEDIYARFSHIIGRIMMILGTTYTLASDR